jgi:hypothetical protein
MRLESPVNDLELLERALPTPDQDAVDAALARSIGTYRRIPRAPGKRRPVRGVGLVGLVATLVMAAVLLVVEPWRPTGETAVARAAAMVSPDPHTVLYVRMNGHQIAPPSWEQWIAPDGSWRLTYAGTNRSGPCTVEKGYSASSQIASTYAARTRTIYSLPLPPAQVRLARLDPLAKTRSWLASGRLHEAGELTLDGRRVTRLVPTHGTSLYGEIAEYIDARTAQPVRLQVSATKWYDFTAYERLPASPDNLRLTSLQAQHPRATLRHGWGGCASG